MSFPPTEPRRPPRLAHRSFAHVVAASLIMGLAIPGFVFLATYPVLGVAFGAGALTARALPRIISLGGGVGEWAAGVQQWLAITAE